MQLKKIKLKSRHLVSILTIAVLALIVVSGVLIFKLNELSKTTSKYESEIYRLIDEKNNLAFGTPNPGTNFEKGTRFQVDGFSVLCPDGVVCEYDKDSGFFSIPGAISFYVEKLDIKSINNPNFKTALDWYTALLNKDTTATGDNLPTNYGARPGYEWGYVQPFYKYYDFKSMRFISIGNESGITIRNSYSGRFEYLFSHNKLVYRINSYDIDPFSDRHMTQLLNTIQFDN